MSATFNVHKSVVHCCTLSMEAELDTISRERVG